MDLKNLTCEDIMSLSFPYKLWLLAHLDFYKFLQWSENGTSILLDAKALEKYLNSECCILNVASYSNFIQHLEAYQFKRLNTTSETGEATLLQYENIYFQSYKLYLLVEMKCPSDQQPKDEDIQNKSLKETCELCSGSYNCLSKILNSNMLKIIVHFRNEVNSFQETLTAEVEQMNQKNLPESESYNNVTEVPFPLGKFLKISNIFLLDLDELINDNYAGTSNNNNIYAICSMIGEFPITNLVEYPRNSLFQMAEFVNADYASLFNNDNSIYNIIDDFSVNGPIEFDITDTTNTYQQEQQSEQKLEQESAPYQEEEQPNLQQ